MRSLNWLLFAIVLLALQEVAGQSLTDSLHENAFSTRLLPVRKPEYYVQQGIKYFQTMQSSVSIKVKPDYSRLVVRWEWPPWLLLTGYGKRNMINSDILLKLYKTTYDTIDCKYFDKEPFCRCHVVFNYSGKRCPIYEEFTFNDQGEITFIEAWSDYPSLIPMDKSDYWAEGNNVKRLSTRVPGLGNSTGQIDPYSGFMQLAADKDPQLADLINRLKHPVYLYMKELYTHRKDLENALTPPVGDVYPYHQ